MRDKYLESQQEVDLLKHYFILQHAYKGQEINNEQIYKEAGERVYLSFSTARKKIARLIKHPGMVKRVQYELLCDCKQLRSLWTEVDEKYI